MKHPVIISILIISVLISQVPIDYKFSTNNTLNRYENITEEGLNSNSIVDIRPIDESYLLMSTAVGLSFARIDNANLDSVSFGSFNRKTVSLPRGGAPALAVKDNIIAISGIIDTTTIATGEEQMGTGISYSIDEGESWHYLHQPIDAIPESGLYH